MKMRQTVEAYRKNAFIVNATIADAVDIATAILINNSRSEAQLIENLKVVGQQLSKVRTNVVCTLDDKKYLT